MTTVKDTYESPDFEARPPLPALPALSLDDLMTLRDLYEQESRYVRDCRDAFDAELDRRFAEAHPFFDPESGGTVEIAGDGVIVKLSYTRNYSYKVEELAAIRGDDLITEHEYEELIPKWEPKVSATVFSSLLKRGGELAERLTKARSIGRATPKFEPRARQ